MPGLGLGLGLGIGGHWWGGLPVTPADYIIASEADWTTVLGLTPAQLAGKVVEVQPLAAGAAYTPKTITHAPATPLTFRGPATGALPLIRGFTHDGSANLVMDRLKLVPNAWNVGGSLVTFNGSVGAHSYTRCVLKGGYGGPGSTGNLWDNDIDPNKNDYPEYACIEATMAGGAVTALTITNAFVGALMADGSYPLILQETGGTGFDATMTVAAGVITGTTLTAGGTGYAMTRHVANRITWAGQNRMADYLKYGFQVTGGATAFTGLMTIEDCEFYDLLNGFKLAAQAGLVCRRNRFDRVYSDYMTVVNDTADAPDRVEYSFNFLTRPFAKDSDPGNPHSDAFQFSPLNVGTVDWPDIQIFGNVVVSGLSRGALQGVFLTDLNTGYYYGTAAKLSRVCGNLLLVDGSSYGVQVQRGRNMLVAHNTTVVWTPTNPPNAAIKNITVAEGDGVGIERNISEGYGGILPAPDANNIGMGLNGASIAFADLFVAPQAGGIAPALATLIANYTPKAAYAGFGATDSGGYIDLVAQSIDYAREPSVWRHTPLTGQEPSTLITSNWAQVIGGVASLAVTPGAGVEWRGADDAAGLNATLWSAAAGTIVQGKFLQIRATTSAGFDTETLTAITVGASARNWSLRTKVDLTAPTYATGFTAPNGTLLSAFDGGWTKVQGTGDFDIQVNQLAKIDVNNGSVGYLRAGGARKNPKADLLYAGPTIYLMARASSNGTALTGYGLRWASSTSVRLWRMVGGVLTSLGTYTVPALTGLELRVTDPDAATVRIEVYQAGALQATYNDISADRLTTGTAGVYYAGGSLVTFAAFDNYSDVAV